MDELITALKRYVSYGSSSQGDEHRWFVGKVKGLAELAGRLKGQALTNSELIEIEKFRLEELIDREASLLKELERVKLAKENCMDRARRLGS